MGVEESAIALKDIAVNKVNRNFFEFQYVVGKGGFGKVYFYLYYVLIYIIKTCVLMPLLMNF